MYFRELCEKVCEANRQIGRTGLTMLTWGNASGVDRDAGVMGIKPSGVDYADLTPEAVVVLSLADGEVVQGDLKPSSDTPTHLELYRAFEGVGGVVHTHSHYGTAWAQACREIPCYGTTHADVFHGPVPVTRALTAREVKEAYESNTGLVIVECFRRGGLDPVEMPGVMVAGHAPFAWGDNAAQALEHARVLEEIAAMALHTLAIDPGATPVPQYLLDKHYLRKHGTHAYYGQQ